MAAWQAESLDGSLLGVFAQVFDGNAGKRGAVTRLNSTTEHDQAEPALGTDSAGNLLAAWASYGQDGDRGSIVLRRFDSSLSPLSEEKRVNQTAAGHQHAPLISVGPDGSFVVAWVTEEDEKNPAALSFRGFAASGEASTAEISVTQSDSALVLQEVEILPLGEIRVRWAQVGGDAGGVLVLEQVFNPTGTPQGAPVLLSSE
ncbi:MAG TPA: hypothetical protein PK413_04745 [Thermoanaerobaculia bacterium]|nr:hypothetical protein [Thermoanaerobaculia bacterium]